MARQFLIIGVGRFGSAVAAGLFDHGHEVVAIDTDEEALEMVADRVTHAAVVDATDDEALQRLGIRNFDTVIVAIGENLEASILATVAAKSAGADYVISKANDKLTARILASVGADEIVRPEHDMGSRLARQLAAPTEVSALELGPDHSIVEVETKDRLCDTLAALRLPSRFGVSVLAVHRDSEIVVNPGASFRVEEGDRLVVIGQNTAFEKLREFVNG